MRYRGFFHTAEILNRRWRALVGGLYYYYAKAKGVTFNGSPRIIGKPTFRRYPLSHISIGKGVEFLSGSSDNLIGINRPCILSTQAEGAQIVVGDNCGFSGSVIGCFVKITLGNNVKCGANTLITDSNWHPEDPRSGEPKEVVIGDNVWLGVNSTVLKGVHIGDNSVIGANSVVVKDIPSNVVAAGNPCKVIRQL
jgi:acetyltransferase-like isoleucine patch superfamily enzyme